MSDFILRRGSPAARAKAHRATPATGRTPRCASQRRRAGRTVGEQRSRRHPDADRVAAEVGRRARGAQDVVGDLLQPRAHPEPAPTLRERHPGEAGVVEYVTVNRRQSDRTEIEPADDREA